LYEQILTLIGLQVWRSYTHK